MKVNVENIKCKNPNCDNFVFGRSNRKFCNDLCKQEFNNSKAKSIREELKGMGSALMKSHRILLDFPISSRRFFRLSKKTLISLGFPSILPTVRIKLEHSTIECDAFGSYAFYIDGDNYYFIKYAI